MGLFDRFRKKGGFKRTSIDLGTAVAPRTKVRIPKRKTTKVVIAKKPSAFRTPQSKKDQLQRALKEFDEIFGMEKQRAPKRRRSKTVQVVIKHQRQGAVRTNVRRKPKVMRTAVPGVLNLDI